MKTLLRGARVWDGGDALPAQADVVIEGSQIAEVGHGLDADREVDLSGLTLLPGLFDCHVHVAVSTMNILELMQTPPGYRYFQAADNLRKTLWAGITTARDAGGADAGIRNAVRDQLVDGPNLQISVTMLSQTGGHADLWMPCGIQPSLATLPGSPTGVADGPDEVRKRVREIIRAGADVIKVATSGGVLSPHDDPRLSQFNPDELAVIGAEAAAAGLSVMAHAQSPQAVKNAIRAGARSIEHGIYLDDECLDLMLSHRTFLVPTLSAPQAVVDAAARGVAIPTETVSKATEVIAAHADSFGRAVRAGVRLAMGTDSGVAPHGRNLRELQLMHAGGLPVPAVLRAASSDAAELLAVQNRSGSVEPGKTADLIAVSGDAFDLRKLPQGIQRVFKGGREIHRDGQLAGAGQAEGA